MPSAQLYDGGPVGHGGIVVHDDTAVIDRI